MTPMLTCFSLWKGYKQRYFIHYIMYFHIQSVPPGSNAELWSCQCRNPSPSPCIVLFSMHSSLPLATRSHADAVHHTCPCDALSTAGHGSGSMRTYNSSGFVCPLPLPYSLCSYSVLCCIQYSAAINSQICQNVGFVVVVKKCSRTQH